MFIIQFIVLQIIVFAVIIFVLKKLLYSDTQGAINRLDSVYQDLVKKQTELTQKIEVAEKEYQAKKQEGAQIAEKLKTEAVEEGRAKKDEILKQAKAQAEEVLGKAKAAVDDLHQKITQEVTRKMMDTSVGFLQQALSPNTLKILHDQMVQEFIERCKELDLSNIGAHVDQLMIKSAFPLSKETIEQFKQVISSKITHAVKVETVEEKKLGAGVALQFVTLLLDGSFVNAVKETSEQAKLAVT